MIDGLFNPRRPPTLTRLLFLAVTAAIVYLSLYPLTGWRLRQPSMFSFFLHGLPRHYSQADVVSNIAAYVLFGLLLLLGWFDSDRPLRAVVGTGLLGFVLSASLESLQSYLPARVPSLLDVYANVAGTLLGATFAIAVGRSRARRGADRQPVSLQWYRQGPALGWVLLIAWVISQLPTQRLLFSTGHVLDWLGGPLARVAQGLAPAALQGVLETAAIAVMIGVLGVLVMDLVRPVGARLGWIGGLLLAGLLIRAALGPISRSETPLLVWLTSGAQAGIVMGAALLYLVGAFDRRQRLMIGSALVPAGIVLVYLASADPYFMSTIGSARSPLEPAMTPSLRSLINTLGSFWPLLTLAYFVVRLTTTRRPPRTRSL